MKKPHVLNRSMFNQGGTSAYGKGITSNLVSDEQRQRFNYGGRVKLREGNKWWDISDTDWGQAGKAAWGIPQLYGQGDVLGQNVAREDMYMDWPTIQPEIEIEKGVPGGGDPGMRTPQSSLLAKKLSSLYDDPDALAKSGVVDEGSDTLDIMEELKDIYKPTEEDIKARQTGRAFKVMGTLGKLAFTPWKTKEFGKVLGAEGESWAKEAEKDIEDKKTMKILAGQAVGKKVAAEEKGIQTRMTAQVARDAIKNAKTDVGKTFWSAMANKPWKDKNIADTLRAASEGAIDFINLEDKDWQMIVKDPAQFDGDQIIYKGDIMVVDRDKPKEQWSVKAQIFAKI